MKKRLFIFALAAVISLSAVSLVGCGKNVANNATVSASATPSEATKAEESTVNTTAPAQTQTNTSAITDTKTENKSADNKLATKGTEATAPTNNASKRRTILRQVAPRRVRAAIKALRAAVRPTIRAAKARIKTQAIIPIPTTARPQRVRQLINTPVRLGTKRYIKPSITLLKQSRLRL